MAVVGKRVLLRDPKWVFSQIEDQGEPVLVTDRGRPVAAMYPVDPERAEELMLAAAPEYVESRRQAENARAEGRTQSLESAIEEYNARAPAAEQIEADDAASPVAPVHEPEPVMAGGLIPIAELRAIFGHELAAEVAREAAQRMSAISESLVGSAEEAGLLESKPKDVVERVQQLSAQLYAEVMRDVLIRAARERVAALAAEGPDISYAVGAEGMFDKGLARETLDTAGAYVEQFNGEVLGLAPPEGAGALLATYSASMKVATGFGRVTGVRLTTGLDEG
jgi:antitoxin (DNA-binding transcriptional repressor) of toxin-antitoxin stability system